jgi:hypothetical protein
MGCRCVMMMERLAKTYLTCGKIRISAWSTYITYSRCYVVYIPYLAPFLSSPDMVT